MSFAALLDRLQVQDQLPNDLKAVLLSFYDSFETAMIACGKNMQQHDPVMETFLKIVVELIRNPYAFPLFHKAIRAPFDYHKFGLDLFRPLVLLSSSTIMGEDVLNQISQLLAKQENVIFFANHQTELDPQAISFLLESSHPDLAEKMIFVAGHRVVTDPLAIPLSMGCNLLCIYSKKYVENPPENKQEKLQHNQKTMKKMCQLLSEGGQCIYVAPSGGRDRPNNQGMLEVAPFDPQSIEMFWLMSQQAERKTHFFPMALATYDLLPPPDSTQQELGEPRKAQCTPIHMAIGQEIDMKNIVGDATSNKKELRQLRGAAICELVKNMYAALHHRETH